MCIRDRTYIHRTPASIKDKLTADQYKLYNLIYSRFLASQMTPARYENMSYELEVEGYQFRATFSKMVFNGFRAAYDTPVSYTHLVLQFGSDQVYRWAIRLISLAEVAGYIWFTVEGIIQIWTGKRIPLAPVQEVFTPLPDRKMEDAQRRLEAEPNPTRKMKKKDYLLMLAITAVYAIAALTNLGSHVIPERTSPSVSYTHLDVYKRQMRYISAGGHRSAQSCGRAGGSSGI